MSGGAEAVGAALAEVAAGRMVVLTDDAGREDEGDLCLAAEAVTAEAVNFMATHGRGLICLTMTEARAEALELPPMVADNTSAFGTAFTVSIEAREGVSTGISAPDRARTIAQAARADCRPADLARPGHVFPLRARVGGVLARRGQTEGSVDLMRLAGLGPMGVICEIMADDGQMLRGPGLTAYAERFGLVRLSVADLVAARWAEAPALRALAGGAHPQGRWQVMQSSFDGRRHGLFARLPSAAARSGELCLASAGVETQLAARAGDEAPGEVAVRVVLAPGPDPGADAYLAARLAREAGREALAEWHVPAGWGGLAAARAAEAGLGVGCVRERMADTGH